MNRSYFPMIFSGVLLMVTWLLIFLFVWGLHRAWWSDRRVRRALWMVPLGIAVLTLLWAGVATAGWEGVELALRSLSAATMVVSIGILVTLPVTGIVLSIERFWQWLTRRRRPTRLEATHAEEPVDRRRRSVLAGAMAFLPVAASGAGIYGVVRSAGEVLFPEVELFYPDLPAELDGLRILQITDIHLGYYNDLRDLEALMTAAEPTRPDMVLVTGDISDDLAMLPGALELLNGLRPKLGTYVSLGNHEYYRGIREVLRAMERGPIPLLRSEGTVVPVGGSQIYLAGADDPVGGGEQAKVGNDRFLRRTIEASLDGAPSDAFHILMSHRPKGFDAAAALGLPLTLSGHTHGGIQFGIGGRSVLEPVMREHYLWGHYRQGDSQLYTSAGVGSWFPFRLGCGPEAPLYVLRRGSPAGRAT